MQSVAEFCNILFEKYGSNGITIALHGVFNLTYHELSFDFSTGL